MYDTDRFMGFLITTEDDIKELEITNNNKIKLENLKKKLEDTNYFFTNIVNDFMINEKNKLQEDTNYIKNKKEKKELKKEIRDLENYLIERDKFKTCKPSNKYSEEHNLNKFINVTFLITNHKTCCEDFGIDLICPISLSMESLIGATIESIKYGKIDDSTRKYEKTRSCIIDMKTSKGIFKFVMHNLHNGYYPHDYYFSFNNFWDLGEL